MAIRSWFQHWTTRYIKIACIWNCLKHSMPISRSVIRQKFRTKNKKKSPWISYSIQRIYGSKIIFVFFSLYLLRNIILSKFKWSLFSSYVTKFMVSHSQQQNTKTTTVSVWNINWEIFVLCAIRLARWQSVHCICYFTLNKSILYVCSRVMLVRG